MKNNDEHNYTICYHKRYCKVKYDLFSVAYLKRLTVFVITRCSFLCVHSRGILWNNTEIMYHVFIMKHLDETNTKTDLIATFGLLMTGNANSMLLKYLD